MSYTRLIVLLQLIIKHQFELFKGVCKYFVFTTKNSNHGFSLQQMIQVKCYEKEKQITSDCILIFPSQKKKKKKRRSLLIFFLIHIAPKTAP